jgi:uncharacterized protein YegP (UPF0339 family)
MPTENAAHILIPNTVPSKRAKTLDFLPPLEKSKIERKASFEIFLNRRKQPCFRLRAPNGELILQSEAYSSKQAARDSVIAIQKYAAEAEILG